MLCFFSRNSSFLPEGSRPRSISVWVRVMVMHVHDSRSRMGLRKSYTPYTGCCPNAGFVKQGKCLIASPAPCGLGPSDYYSLA